MRCGYHDIGRCRSCTLMNQPYRDQLADKHAAAVTTLGPVATGPIWDTPFASAESGFRNKAKWLIGGTAARPTLGILDRAGRSVDIRGCGVCEPGLSAAFPALAQSISDLELTPYDIRGRTGELKYLIVTIAPDGRLMVRYVLRSPDRLDDLRSYLPRLQTQLPAVAVVSVNLQPEPKAVLEGDTEIVLSERQTLEMTLDAGITLHLRTRSFFQTNTAVATGLYRQAARWADQVAPASILDLYCGVGGFAVYSAAAGTGGPGSVRGIEVSAEAIQSAQDTVAGRPDADRFSFVVGDATHIDDDKTDDDHRTPAADLVIVNPPRRGIGAALAGRLEASDSRAVIYSSCNPTTLAADLALMPSLRPVRARLFDMFPQTRHAEVAVLLERR